MGIDLRLYPVECDQPGLVFSHTILDVPRWYELYEEIRAIMPVYANGSGRDCLTAFASSCKTAQEDRGYGYIERDAYGEPLRAVMSDDLYRVMSSIVDRNFMTNGAMWIRRCGAVAAYLHALPSQTKVFLYWH